MFIAMISQLHLKRLIQSIIKMVEKYLVVNNRNLTYKGIFRVSEIFQTIDESLTKLDYEKREKKTEEKVVPGGKKTFIELRPYKNKSNYVSLMIKIKITLDRVTETVKEVDGIKKKFQQGDVSIVFDSWSLTDYGARWGMRPLFFLLKGIVNKYFYHFPLEESFFGELKTDTNYLTQQIKALLNLYKYQSQDPKAQPPLDSVESP